MSHQSPRKASLPRTVPGGAFGPKNFAEGLLLQNARPKWGLDGLLNWNQRIVKEESVVTNSQINSMAARGLGAVQPAWLKEPVSTEYQGCQAVEFATRKWHLMQDLMEREMSKRKVHHLYTYTKKHTRTHAHTRTHTHTHTHTHTNTHMHTQTHAHTQAPVPQMDMHHTAAYAKSAMMTPHLRKLRARRDEEGMVTHRGRLERSGGTETNQ